MKIYLSHSLKGADLTVLQIVTNLARDYGIEINYQADSQPRMGPIDESVKQNIQNSEILMAFVSRTGSKALQVLDEINLAKSLGKKIIVIAERGIQTKEFAEGSHVIPYDARYTIDTIKRAVTYLKPLNLKREDNERAKALIGSLVFLMSLAYFGRR
ncbi:MAG TPA: hypothetical protein VJ165_03590 [candidate division Zixibacteria bacterium]|nr:hypothetical protein [candidate division Zixibacteria bacterium]